MTWEVFESSTASSVILTWAIKLRKKVEEVNAFVPENISEAKLAAPTFALRDASIRFNLEMVCCSCNKADVTELWNHESTNEKKQKAEPNLEAMSLFRLHCAKQYILLS